MSTPAALENARAHAPGSVRPLTPNPAERPRRRRRTALVLPVLFALAAAYHAIQGTLHVSPAVFTDELLHSKLAQSLASGEGFTIRGEPFFFPSALPALFQAPAWLLSDTSTAYAVAKVLNALVMSTAVFPAYWLARQVVRPTFALLSAGAAVAAPAMLYHSYLLSEALAYPVFLGALAVLVRALSRPSVAWGAAAVAVSLVAVATRMQFVVLPVVFALLLVVRPRELRRHAVPALALGALAVVALVGGTALLGTYSGLRLLDFSVSEVARWTASTGVLVPFAAGVLVVPGALLGLALLAARPRRREEGAFAWLALGVGALFLGQAGLIATGDAGRPLERYVIYLAPLAVIAFFAYAERGAPARRIYAGLALALGLLAWLVPFPSLADYRFTFDSPVLSAYGALAHWIGNADAATVFAAVPLAAGVAVALVRLTPRAATALGAATIVLLFVTGLVAYAGDHAMTQRARAAWAGTPPDWLDELRVGRADFLSLPGGSAHFAWVTEAWNRDFGRPLWLFGRVPPNDPWATAPVDVDGVLEIDGRPAEAGVLVVNDYGSRLELEGQVLARPRPGLTVLRVPRAPRVRSFVEGLYYDNWANGDLGVHVFPQAPDRGGAFELEVSLPYGFEDRDVTIALDNGPRRVVRLVGGRSASVVLPVRPGGLGVLRVTSDREEFLHGGTANPRLVSFRVERLEFRPAAGEPSVSL